MAQDPEGHGLTKAMRTLTVAVWCLCALVLAQLALYGWSYFQSMRWAQRAMTTTTTTSRNELSSARPDPTPEKPFHEMPPEEMVARSSVILLTTYEDNGKRNKAIVAEILKQDPDVRLFYSVGDEYPTLSFDKEKGVSCGEGQVVFLVGSPASMRASYGFTSGRIGGLGDMPLTMLREMVKKRRS